MIFVDIKEVRSSHPVAERSEWGFASQYKRPLRQLIRTFLCRDSNTSFKDTQTRFFQPVDSYAH
jgi:hypothetical protein